MTFCRDCLASLFTIASRGISLLRTRQRILKVFSALTSLQRYLTLGTPGAVMIVWPRRSFWFLMYKTFKTFFFKRWNKICANFGGEEVRRQTHVTSVPLSRGFGQLLCFFGNMKGALIVAVGYKKERVNLHAHIGEHLERAVEEDSNVDWCKVKWTIAKETRFSLSNVLYALLLLFRRATVFFFSSSTIISSYVNVKEVPVAIFASRLATVRCSLTSLSVQPRYKSSSSFYFNLL